jgi:hypothetical protein
MAGIRAVRSWRITLKQLLICLSRRSRISVTKPKLAYWILMTCAHGLDGRLRSSCKFVSLVPWFLLSRHLGV